MSTRLMLGAVFILVLAGCVSFKVEESYDCSKSKQSLIDKYIKTCTPYYPRLVCEDKAKQNFCKIRK